MWRPEGSEAYPNLWKVLYCSSKRKGRTAASSTWPSLWLRLPEAEEMGAWGCWGPRMGAQSWSAVGLKATRWSEGSSGRVAEAAADSARAVSSTAGAADLEGR